MTIPFSSPLMLAAGAIVLAGLLPSCVSVETAAPPVTQLSPPGQGNYAQLCAGRDLYLGKCTKCHSPEPIRKFSLAEWHGEVMPSMAKKSKISAEEEASLMAYIAAVSKAPAPPPKS